MAPIRVMVVDDHAVVREGIRHVLGDPERYAVVAEASSAAEAIERVASASPDVIILDISMPGGSGLGAVAELVERAPRAKVLMLSVHDDTEYVIESVHAGAHGYLRKDSTPAELRTAIATVCEGRRYYSPQVAGVLASALRNGGEERPAGKPPRATDVLSPRELEILAHIADGETSREIGALLGISVRTVEAHRNSLMRKLGVRTIAGLTRLAIEQELVGHG
ncbi:MAG: response regulator transcription factor [Gemmatimonadaceae bacterium]|nr:response regulator transcription factor [Gemmatimonadaceae bacterium]